MIGITKLEEHVSAEGGRTLCGRPFDAPSFLEKRGNKSNASPRRSTSYSLRIFAVTIFEILGAPTMSTAPCAIIVVFSFPSSETLLTETNGQSKGARAGAL